MSPLVSTGWPKKFPNRSEALPFSNRDIVTAISHCRHVPCGLIPSSQNFSNVDVRQCNLFVPFERNKHVILTRGVGHG